MINQTYLLMALGFVFIVLLFTFKTQVRNIVNRSLTSFRDDESKILEVTNAISAEIHLLPLLQKIIETATDILAADRSTLFLYDSQTNELWSQIAEGTNVKEIRFPANIGIAGSVFTTGEFVNIKDAYKDERFNQAVDKKTGYRTRSILCMQVCNKQGEAIGVIQVLNKKNGVFAAIDEKRLQAFSAQAAIAIENAQLFDEMATIKNYNEAIIESMSNGVLSIDADGVIVKVNKAALRIFGLVEHPERLLSENINTIFAEKNQWVIDSVQTVFTNGVLDESLDVQIHLGVDGNEYSINVNLRILALGNSSENHIGVLMVIEDITNMKRLRTTMARYMTKELADKLLEEGEQALGGNLQVATILFSDIRSFTSFSEKNGPQETVAMLNEYFSVMFDLILANDGILDKYIGDAIMAVFGAPFTSAMDADNALNCAVDMMHSLREFNSIREGVGQEAIHIGIGISTGQVVSGNIGSDKRMDYTVIGDGVNLSARLEGATKVYKTPILISEMTVNALSDSHPLREIDCIRVKGKERPVAIYEALEGMTSRRQAAINASLPLFEKSLEWYRKKEWSEAISGFESILSTDPEDLISKLYLDRCHHFIMTPPIDSWDGVWEMKTK